VWGRLSEFPSVRGGPAARGFRAPTGRKRVYREHLHRGFPVYPGERQATYLRGERTNNSAHWVGVKCKNQELRLNGDPGTTCRKDFCQCQAPPGGSLSQAGACCQSLRCYRYMWAMGGTGMKGRLEPPGGTAGRKKVDPSLCLPSPSDKGPCLWEYAGEMPPNQFQDVLQLHMERQEVFFAR